MSNPAFARDPNSKTQRAIAVLRDGNPHTYQEIADAIGHGYSPRKVKNLLEAVRDSSGRHSEYRHLVLGENVAVIDPSFTYREGLPALTRSKTGRLHVSPVPDPAPSATPASSATGALYEEVARAGDVLILKGEDGTVYKAYPI